MSHIDSKNSKNQDEITFDDERKTFLSPHDAFGTYTETNYSTVYSFTKNISPNTTITSVGPRFKLPPKYRNYGRRVILKNGECNVAHMKLAKHKFKFLQDIFTTLVDIQWRYTLIAFAFSFVGCWLFFGTIWYLICFVHGDLEDEHLPEKQAENNWIPCVQNIYSFTSTFLFSLETQTTIGFGVRSTTEQCPEALFVVCLQSVSGLIMQAFMVGIVFAKMTRPKKRAQTLLFSKIAVICQRDGELGLMFRIGDMRKSHIIGANVRAQLIRPKVTQEGEKIRYYSTELKLGTDGCNSDIFFIWPMVVVHRITPDSPFWNMSAVDFIQDRSEIVVILEGTVESTGQTTQARSSYINSEIMWGHRFEQIVTFNKTKSCYEINYAKFNSIKQVDTPLCSAKVLASVMDDLKNNRDNKKKKSLIQPHTDLRLIKKHSM